MEDKIEITELDRVLEESTKLALDILENEAKKEKEFTEQDIFIFNMANTLAMNTYEKIVREKLNIKKE